MIGWLDGGAGVSGDMLLGALVDAGVPLELLQDAVDAVLPGEVRLSTEPVERGGLGALRVVVDAGDDASGPSRPWRTVRELLERASLDDAVRATALQAFTLLAEAEAAVHRVAVDDVHLHEVGARDAVADVVGAAAGLASLGLTSLTASTVSVGSGTTRGAHGPLPVPAPAVLALLAGVPVQAGPAAHEATTPTGAALLRATVTAFGPLPPMRLQRVGVGAGGRDRPEVANALRLVLGEPVGQADRPAAALVVEANVDDLDPRIWPLVLGRLLDAGAHDAWLTPVLMKKGRPAHVLSALCPPAAVPAVEQVVLTETTTIGLRRTAVTRTVLERAERTVDVDGQPVRVKTASRDGLVVNAMPEFDDVVAAAHALGRPVKAVLLAAHAAVAQSG
ncbi:MAG TPA: nickel pincer cofactor biosynthesis protein LarC [Mycobacteriales bacterium]|nr:nickel pincer cofactor biosynthesis protein LarC [Mycobacteriales bacterium]